MAIQAFVLIETTAGMMEQAVQTLGDITGITAVDIVTGPYDLIATVEGGSFDEVQRKVDQVIRLAPGVARTITCLKINNGRYSKAA